MDAIQAEKETAMRRYRRLQQIGTLLRCLEAAAVLLLLSWSSARLPAAARLSVDFLRRLAAVLLSPRFVFLLGNAIVLLLFAKSGQLSSSSSSSAASSTAAASSGSSDVYEEFLECRGGRLTCSLAPPPPSQQQEREEQQQPEEVVYEDKEVCVETRAYRRSRSERMERRRSAPQPKLHRSETDLTWRKFPRTEAEEHEEEEEKQKQVAAEAEDAEEFRRAVEAFIARQTKFHLEECMAATFSPPLICSSSATPPQ